MTRVQYLRDQATRADRLAQNMLDTLTVTRLTEASRDYRQQADLLELNQPRIRTEHAAS